MPANVQFYEVSRHELGRDTGETLRAAYRQFVALYPPPMFGDGANLIMQWKRDAALQSPPPREAELLAVRYAVALMTERLTIEAPANAEIIRRHIAALLAYRPPPREADAALWPLVEEWTVAHREWMAPHGHSLDGPEYRRYDEARTALLAYRPPSAPAPAAPPDDLAVKLIRRFLTWRDDGLSRAELEPIYADMRALIAALDSPPPPETQP